MTPIIPSPPCRNVGRPGRVDNDFDSKSVGLPISLRRRNETLNWPPSALPLSHANQYHGIFCTMLLHATGDNGIQRKPVFFFFFFFFFFKQSFFQQRRSAAVSAPPQR